MTRIKQNTSKVHLAGDDGAALCDFGERPVFAVPVLDWKEGFTPAAVGARICRDCEAKAGTAARYEPGEKDEGTTWKPLDRPKPRGEGQDIPAALLGVMPVSPFLSPQQNIRGLEAMLA